MNTQKIMLRRTRCKPVIAVASAIFFVLSASATRAAETADPRRWVAENMPQLVELYRTARRAPAD